MKKNIISYFVVLLAFISGAGFTFLLVKYDIVDTKKLATTVDNGEIACTDCSEKTRIINNNGISAAVDKVYDSVVMIKNYKKGYSNGSGSGVVYKKDDKYGYILTNYHVIEGATEIYIVLSNNKEVDGEILGGDEYLDIAVVRINANDVIKVAPMGNLDECTVGDQVFAVGTPIGEDYFNTVTAGYISGLNRKVTVSVKSTADWVQEVTQIDAAINPGNSGGPLFNINGEIIGLNSMKLVNSSIEGMAFSVKVDDIKQHVEEFEKGEKIQRVLLGINYINVSDTYTLYRQGITLDKNISSGVVVMSTVEGSGAEKAKIKKGDVITKINDEEVLNRAYLKYILYKYKAGDEIEVTYIRDGKESSAKVTLTESDD